MTTELATYVDDAEVQEAQTAVRTVADQARALEIVNDATNAVALDMLSRSRGAVKKVEALRHRFVDPLNAQVKLINDHFKAMAAPASEADAILTGKTSAYRARAAQEAREEQERLRKLAEARQVRAEERAAERGVEPPVPAPFMPTIAAPAKSLTTEAGSKITYRKTVHFEVVDETLVPRPFWVIDQAKIGAAVRSGLPVPGVRVWETEEPVVR
jgi:hypothetical protein